MSKTPDGGVNIEVPVDQMKITGHPPTVTARSDHAPRLADLLRDPRETLDIELKEWRSLNAGSPTHSRFDMPAATV